MEVDGTLLTILGVSAGVLILTGWVEQIYKGYKTNVAGLTLMIIISFLKMRYDKQIQKI